MKDMPKSAEKFYRIWIAENPETWHESDLTRFYMFVDVLLSRTRKVRTRDWFEKNLKEDCKKLSFEDIQQYCDLYDHLRGFKNVWKSQLAQLTLKGLSKPSV